ncbi:MAG: leucine-rich repeat domain-containing protein, partial [Treponemataceae bacterium]|nr:leucine-rich repeat domain-containing protein [Treponemataceae bacterium]
MKKKWITALAAMVLAMAALAAKPEFPSYLIMDGTTVTGYTGKVPADLVIPEGVEKIGSSVFHGCDSLDSVTIPGSVKTIGRYAFPNCIYLERITIGDGVQTIDEGAFSGCTSLASVTIPGSVQT